MSNFCYRPRTVWLCGTEAEIRPKKAWKCADFTEKTVATNCEKQIAQKRFVDENGARLCGAELEKDYTPMPL